MPEKLKIQEAISQARNMKEFDPVSDKIALVTGSGSGIGLGIATRLALEGARVALVDKDKKSVDLLAELLRVDGLVAHAFVADVGDARQREELLAGIEKHFGGVVEILVNNAGIGRHATVFDTDFHVKWDEVIAINLEAPVMLSVLVAAHMKEKGVPGNIINITSVHSEVPVKNGIYYPSAKAGLDAATKSMALELAPFGIRVNAIAPGAIMNTGMNKAITSENDQKKARELRIPLERHGKPEEIAEGVIALLRNTYITGQQIFIDGGFTLNH